MYNARINPFNAARAATGNFTKLETTLDLNQYSSYRVEMQIKFFNLDKVTTDIPLFWAFGDCSHGAPEDFYDYLYISGSDIKVQRDIHTTQYDSSIAGVTLKNNVVYTICADFKAESIQVFFDDQSSVATATAVRPHYHATQFANFFYDNLGSEPGDILVISCRVKKFLTEDITSLLSGTPDWEYFVLAPNVASHTLDIVDSSLVTIDRVVGANIAYATLVGRDTLFYEWPFYPGLENSTVIQTVADLSAKDWTLYINLSIRYLFQSTDPFYNGRLTIFSTRSVSGTEINLYVEVSDQATNGHLFLEQIGSGPGGIDDVVDLEGISPFEMYTMKLVKAGTGVAGTVTAVIDGVERGFVTGIPTNLQTLFFGGSTHPDRKPISMAIFGIGFEYDNS